MRPRREGAAAPAAQCAGSVPAAGSARSRASARGRCAGRAGSGRRGRRYISSGSSCASSSSCTFTTAIRAGARPRRFATRSTCVSTGSAGPPEGEQQHDRRRLRAHRRAARAATPWPPPAASSRGSRARSRGPARAPRRGAPGCAGPFVGASPPGRIASSTSEVGASITSSQLAKRSSRRWKAWPELWSEVFCESSVSTSSEIASWCGRASTRPYASPRIAISSEGRHCARATASLPKIRCGRPS